MLAGAALACLSACEQGSTVPGASEDAAPRAAAEAGYVGAAACTPCHAAAAQAWSGSDHDRAMQAATAATVLGDFADATLTVGGVETRFVTRDGRFAIRTQGADGAMVDLAVVRTFGVRPLQQYLVPFARGRLQAFPIAWDTERRRWFSLYPDEPTAAGRPLWTHAALNWNQGCADCHSTALRKGYDAATDSYATTWVDEDVACEACHGPGGAHVEWARSRPDGTDVATDSAVPVHLAVGPLAGRDRRAQVAQVETCARCHAHRRVVHPDDRPGRPLLDAWAPALLEEGLYHADGQIIGEVFEYGSFVQSRMFHEGVACSDCHEPHGLRLVAKGNALCTRCHAATAYDAPAHVHHPAASPAARCISCHMRTATFMEVDDRRDHGFHIPRPDLTVAVGVPNACNGCHAERPAAWAQARVVEWFGKSRPVDVHATEVLADGRMRKAGADGALVEVATDPARPAIVRATAVDLLRHYQRPVAVDGIRRALDDPDALVRGVAIDGLRSGSPEQLGDAVRPRLADGSRFVRTQAARALVELGRKWLDDLQPEEQQQFHVALDEYRAGQLFAADRAPAHLNLAVVHQHLGERDAARSAYRRAIAIDPAFHPARFNLAMLDAAEGRRRDAEAQLREVVRLAPSMAEAYFSLGLLLAEDTDRLFEAIAMLRDAARLAPAEPRMQLNAGLALQRAGRHAEAEPYVRAAVELAPRDARARHALVVLLLQQRRWDEAREHAVRLAELRPDDPGPRELLNAVDRARAESGRR